jgi:hypothetical protein
MNKLRLIPAVLLLAACTTVGQVSPGQTSPNRERTAGPATMPAKPSEPVAGIDIPTDLPTTNQNTALAIDNIFDFVQRDFQAVADMASSANPVDNLGKECGQTTVSAVNASRKSVGGDTRIVGLASAAEKVRLAERSVIYYAPVYMEARDRCRAAGIDLKVALAGLVKLVPGLKAVLP